MILQIIGTLRGGGAERVALTLQEGFEQLNKEAKVLVLNQKVDYEIESPNIIFSNEIEKYIKQSSLVVVHMQDVAEKLIDFKHQNKIWFVVHNSQSKKFKQRNIFSRIKKTLIFKKIYNSANIICVSKGVQRDLIDNLKIKANKIKTIYNPFNFDKIKELSKEPIDLNFDYIINVGALNRVKRQDLLIKAYSKLNTHLHLVLLGKGNQEKSLKKLAKNLKIEDRVHFLGWNSNPYKFIKNAKLFVLSSDIEGFGNVLVESLVLDTPVVSTNCPSGPNEILVDELGKFLVEPNNEIALIEKIELALEEYPIIKQEYYNKFDYKKIAQEYLL